MNELVTVAKHETPKKLKLEWSDMRSLGRTDNGGRWYPNEDLAEYFTSIRSPSRSWPNSYAKAAQTVKFAKWLAANKPELAKRLGM